MRTREIALGILLSVFMLAFSAVIDGDASAKERLPAKQCVRGLLKAKQLINERNLSISEKYVAAQIGGVMMGEAMIGGDDTKLENLKAGELKDLHACIDVNLWQAPVHTVLINVLNGFYEDGGKGVLVNCMAAISVTEAYATKLFGKIAGKNVGFELGNYIAIVAVQMGYLFTGRAYDQEEFLAQAGRKIAGYNQIKSQKNRLTVASSFMNGCAKIGIDIKLTNRILLKAGK